MVARLKRGSGLTEPSSRPGGIAADLGAVLETMARAAADQQDVAKRGWKSIRKSPLELFSYWQTRGFRQRRAFEQREASIAKGDDLGEGSFGRPSVLRVGIDRDAVLRRVRT